MIDFDIESFVRKYMTKRPESLLAADFAKCGDEMHRRIDGKSTRGWQSFMTLNKEIVRGNRENGYFCCFPMLLPKYLFKIFEFILPRLGFK